MTKRTLIWAILALSACGDDDTMTDAGPSTMDVGPSTSDTGPSTTDAGPVTGAARYRALEVVEFTQYCDCGVSAGDFPDLEACFAAGTDEVSTETELTCVQGVLDGAPEADRTIWECRSDGYSTTLDCLGMLSCADLTAEPSSAGAMACLEADDAAFDACGTPSVEQDLNDCFD